MPYKSTREDIRRAYTIGIIYVVLALALGIMLFKIWPPVPWPTPKALETGMLADSIAKTGCPLPALSASPSPSPDQPSEAMIIPISFFGPCLYTTFDERLLLLVIVAGVLGAFVHGATSLADYIGNNNFNRSWTWFYLLRPAIGMALALVFYFVIRGGFLSSSGGAKDINPYGIAALAGLVGMFSKQATDKLSEVFGTLFRSAPGQGDAKRGDPLKPKAGAPIKLEPATVTAGGEAFKLTVTSTGFVEGAVIHLGDAAQKTTFESATTVSVQIAKEIIAVPATLKVTVVNPDGTTFGPADLVVSAAAAAAGNAVDTSSAAAGATATTETPVHGEGGDEESIDGCDVEMKADTPDEDLPITKGGVG